MELQASCSAVHTTCRGTSRLLHDAARAEGIIISPPRSRPAWSSKSNCRRVQISSLSCSTVSPVVVRDCGDAASSAGSRCKDESAVRFPRIPTASSNSGPLVCQEREKEAGEPREMRRFRVLHFSGVKVQYLEERDEGVLSGRLIRLSRNNKVRSALELFASMSASAVRPDSHACNSLVACLIRNDSLDEALEVFEIMRKESMVTGHTFSIILKAVAEARGCGSAVGMFMEMEGERFDIVVYNTMISICGRSKNWLDVERMWNRLRESDCTGTMLTYRLLISTFVQCGQAELALAAYDEMIQNGLEPDEDIMKGIISVCTKEGNWESSLVVFHRMLDRGIQPNAIAFNSVINCLGKAGESDHAFRIYELMRSSGLAPDEYTWNALLNSLYRAGRYADALRLFEFIRKGEQGLNVHLYNVALMSCQRLRRWDRSLQILWKMEESGMQVPTESYNLVILACERASQAKAAVQVYEHMIHRKCIPDTFTHLSLIRACIWGSLWIEVDEILKRAEPSASLYNAIIQGLFLREKIGSAKKMYKKMRASGIDPDGKTRALMLQHLTAGRPR